jgi:hypothetical protein
MSVDILPSAVRRAFPICLLLAGSLFLNAQEFRSFVGANNTLWENPENWNPTDVPDQIGEGARVESGNVVLGGDHVIFTLELLGAGGVVLSQGNALTTSSLVWSGSQSTVSGPGTLIVNQAGTIAPGAFFGGTFRNTGKLVVSAGNGGTGFNLTDTLFENVDTTELTDGAGIGAPLTGNNTSVILNTGFLWKLTGTGTADIGAPVDNRLEVSSRAGTLRLNRGGTSSGRFLTGAGARLRFRGSAWTLTEGATILGDGETELFSGFFTVAEDATVQVDNFALTGGQIDGAGAVVFNGPDNRLQSGSLGGATEYRITPAATVPVAGSITLVDQPVVIVEAGGTLRFPAPGSNFSNNGSPTINNEGTLDFAENGDLLVNVGVQSVLLNAGRLVKSGGLVAGGETILQADLVHEGEFEIQSGRVRLLGNADLLAPVVIQPGAELRIDSSLIASSPVVTLGDGVMIGGGGIFEQRNTVLEVPAGARATVEGYVTVGGGGRVTGEGTFVIGTSGVLDRVQHSGTGVTEIPAGVTVTSGSIFDLDDGRTLRNHGTLELASTFSQNVSGGATLDNNGELRITSTLVLDLASGTFALHNAGLVHAEVPAGPGAARLGVNEYSGDGTLRVAGGRLNLNQPATLSGTVEVLTGAELQGGNLTFADGSVLRGTGKLNGSMTFAGTVQPGLSIGTLEVQGSANFSPESIWEVELGAAGESDQILVSGNGIATLSAPEVRLSLADGLQPAPGDSWTVLTANGTLSGSVGKLVSPPAPNGFGYFISVADKSLIITYGEVDRFARAHQLALAGLNQPLPLNPNLAQAGAEDTDGDGLPNLLDWAFGGNLTAADPARRFEIKSVITGDPGTAVLRYPLNATATDVILSLVAAADPAGLFTTQTSTPAGTELVNGILYQLLEVPVPAGASGTFFRLRAQLVE